MREDAHELLLTALPSVARRMEAYNGEVPAAALGEREQLQPAFEEAVRDAAAELQLSVTLRPEHPFQSVDWESKAGVDLGIRGLPRLAPVFCELKWGDGASVLGECSWDLAKMGLAVTKNACSAAVLLAGAPSRRWQQASLEGAELFADGRHDLAHIRGPLYLQKYWAAYAREGLPQPKQLPAAFEAITLGSQTMTLDDELWELRCAEVLPAGALVPVDPLPTTYPATRPRPYVVHVRELGRQGRIRRAEQERRTGSRRGASNAGYPPAAPRRLPRQTLRP